MPDNELADTQNQQNSEVIQQTPSTPDSPVIGQDTAKKTSLRDELKKNFKELSRPEALAKPERTSDKAPVRQTAEERPRDETGKFVKAEETPKSPQTETKEAEASKPIGPPPGWSAESKASFNSLPDHLKNDVLKREKEISDGFKSKSDEIKRYQELESVLTTLRPIYQRAGVQSDAEAIKRLAMWEAYIRSNPSAAIAEMAKQYGVNLAPNPQTPQEEIPQVVKPILDQFGRMNQELNSLKSDWQRSQEERIAQELTSFAKDKPYFERVRVSMGQLMNAGIATDLSTAYQKAVALSPEIQAEIKSDEEAKKLIENQRHNQERLQKAAQAAVSPSTRAPSASIVNSKKQPGIRGSILQAIEEVRGNGRA